MKDTALYEHLLGLKAPWSVRRVDLSLADQRVVVEVILKKGQIWGDPTDATKRAHINGWSERQWRHLDTCQFESIIKASIPQLKFSDGNSRRTDSALGRALQPCHHIDGGLRYQTA
jgi:hypothetical protein